MTAPVSAKIASRHCLSTSGRSNVCAKPPRLKLQGWTGLVRDLPKSLRDFWIGEEEDRSSGACLLLLGLRCSLADEKLLAPSHVGCCFKYLMNQRLMIWACALSSLALSNARSDEATSTAPTNLVPSWETQRQAATYALAIPAPRGQITDRNGVPLAQTRVSYNLSVVFPTPLDFTDQQIIDFANRRVASLKGLISQPVGFSQEELIQHYRNRGAIPFDLVTDVPPPEVESIRGKLSDGLTLRPIYVRFYPQGSLAGAVVGYTGRTSRNSTRILQNNDP